MNTLEFILLFVAVVCSLVGNILLYFMIKDRPADKIMVSDDSKFKQVQEWLNKVEDKELGLVHYLAKDYGVYCNNCEHNKVCNRKGSIHDVRQLCGDIFMNGELVLCSNYKEETNNGQSGTDESND